MYHPVRGQNAELSSCGRKDDIAYDNMLCVRRPSHPGHAAVNQYSPRLHHKDKTVPRGVKQAEDEIWT